MGQGQGQRMDRAEARQRDERGGEDRMGRGGREQGGGRVSVNRHVTPCYNRQFSLTTKITL